ncbi:hypothetical protein E4U55_003338 [Claviceps digitariae]|nr:hypothetical protein E4U55_003338 [Claviceps digitariae]
MAIMTEETTRVLKLIRRSKLRYPDNELLESFLRDSKDPEQTARYILRRCSIKEDESDLDPGALLTDWKRLLLSFMSSEPAHQLSDKAAIAAIFKRDHGKCRITGLANSIWDRLVVMPLLPSGLFHLDKEQHEILGIFVGSKLLDWLSSQAASLDIYQSHWLVRRSAAAALSQGFFHFDCEDQNLEYSVIRSHIGAPTRPSIVKQAAIHRRDQFSDPSASHVDNPDISALQLISLFSAPIRWTLVSRDIAQKRPQVQPVQNWQRQTASLWHFVVDRGAAVMSMVLRSLPALVRIRAYHGLAFLGSHMYGTNDENVQRLPFGMYIKMKRTFGRALENEFAAVQLVRRHTAVPVPIALDIVSDSKAYYLLTSRVPGVILGSCIDTLSHSEEAALVCDLREVLSQLRAIPKQVAPEYAITNVPGGACYDGRIFMYARYDPEEGAFVGPFVDEAEFHNRLRIGALPDISHPNGHRIVFTHGDLNMRNILMRNGRFAGFVDWEMAGWFPGYWEYTKAHFATCLHQRWLRIVDKVFESFGDFETELAIENKFWRLDF